MKISRQQIQAYAIVQFSGNTSVDAIDKTVEQRDIYFHLSNHAGTIAAAQVCQYGDLMRSLNSRRN
ncbi:hypothetical protein LOE14_19360 (plasmid) [Pseudosulfitobacter pseudonitzschiae]|nr:hypothetical protein [Pseudosulfitobacter pseudonitzschiae]MBM1843994.1 hypothetical protein [Pseudosulfitobacter pseudonitzschiae]MBM1858544.1 hypothetical protein [Pseudosulfitobacter pseudonitzschiae]MBM1882757.1 hypothetical protein [Pseudosulfitobacter pseudonitzschiae]MBM1887614.1 hypothetical protein [Pseudosulfitobacter pseudonitzschiae]